MSRPHILDEHKKSQILALLKSGCGKATAAAAVNCSPNTIVNTAKRDPDFAEKLAMTERRHEITHLRNLNRAAKQPQYWRASAWILERTRPDRYGKTNPDVLTPSQISALMVQMAEIVVQEVPVARFRKQVLKRVDALLQELHPAATFQSAPSNTISLLELSSADCEQHNDEPYNNSASHILSRNDDLASHRPQN